MNAPAPCNTADQRLYRVVADALGVDCGSLTESSSPKTVAEWDSLSHLQLVAAVESEFEVNLAPDDILRIRDLASLRAVLAEQGVRL
jgi:acyl carrier protein